METSEHNAVMFVERGWRFVLVLLCLLAEPAVAQIPYTKPNRAATRVPQQRLNGADTVSTIPVPRLIWLRLDQAQRLLEPLHLKAKVSTPKGQIVISQFPENGNVLTGSVIAITMGQPTLSLSVDPAPPAQIGQDLTFTLAVKPPIPDTMPARYSFRWGDGTESGSVDQAVVKHSFPAAGTFTISGGATVAEIYNLTSDSVAVTIAGPITTTATKATTPKPRGKPTSNRPSYTVELSVRPTSTSIGSLVVAIVSVRPQPSRGTRYRFDWGDGSPEDSPSPMARHAYQTSGQRVVKATVVVDGHEVSSGSSPVQVTRPLWPIVAAVAIGVAVLAALMAFFSGKRPKPSAQPAASSLAYTSKLCSVVSGIPHSGQIRTNLTVRIHGGSSPPVSWIPSGSYRNRSADA